MVRLSARRGDVSEFVATGAMTARDWMETYQAFLEAEPTAMMLWDFTSATWEAASSQELREIARRIGAMEVARGGARKAALVCVRDLDFGLARMFVTMAELESCPVRMAVFRDGDEARDWLADR